MLLVFPIVTIMLLKPLSPSSTDIHQDKIVRKPVVTENKRYATQLNVKDYGAKGDGVSDDSKAINKVLDMVNEGQTVYFPAGNYLVGDALILKNKKNVTISGDGNDSRLFVDKQRTSTSKTTFYSTLSLDGCKNSTVKNLCVESRGENWGILMQVASSLTRIKEQTG